jgi:hypothetical protein
VTKERKLFDSRETFQAGWRGRVVDILAPMAFCAILITLCVFTSLHRLFWIDEIYTYYFATDPSFSHMMGAVSDWINTAPPLYFILIWQWCRIFGNSELAMRLFSCLGYCVGGVAFWMLLKRIFGRWPALSGMFAILIGSKFLAFHNAEARFYGMLFAETSLAVCLFAAICERVKAGSEKLFVLLAINAIVHAALVTTHYFGLVYSAAFLMAFCIFLRHDFRKLCCCCASVLIGWTAFLPCIPMFLHHWKMGKPRNWIPPSTLDELGLTYSGDNTYCAVAAIAFFAFVLFACLRRHGAAFQYLRQSVKTPAKLSLLILAFCLLLIPVGLWSYSSLTKPMFVSRYVLPPVWLGWGILSAFPIQFFREWTWQITSKTPPAQASALRRMVPFVLSAAILLAVAPRVADCLDLVQAGLSIDDLAKVQVLLSFPRDKTVAFLHVHAYLFAERYLNYPKNFILLGDADWAYSDSSDVPQDAAINYKIAMAFKRQYGISFYEAKDFFKKSSCDGFAYQVPERSLYEKWKAETRSKRGHD